MIFPTYAIVAIHRALSLGSSPKPECGQYLDDHQSVDDLTLVDSLTRQLSLDTPVAL